MSIARYHKDIDSIVIQFVNTSGGNSWGKSEIIYKRIVNIFEEKIMTVCLLLLKP
jgi:D-alanyl-D-alanine carboxypeptidase